MEGEDEGSAGREGTERDGERRGSEWSAETGKVCLWRREQGKLLLLLLLLLFYYIIIIFIIIIIIGHYYSYYEHYD